MSTKCKEQVREAGMWPRYHQCKRNAIKDGYCNQHHPDTIREKAEKKQAEYIQKRDNSPVRKLWRACDQLEQADLFADDYRKLRPRLVELVDNEDPWLGWLGLVIKQMDAHLNAWDSCPKV